MAPKEWRDSRSLKLEDVAAMLGCSRMSVWNYETGNRAVPLKIAFKWKHVSDGKVTPDDLHAVREKWRRKHEKKAA